MKKQFILGAIAFATLNFTACSDDNSLDQITNPSENNNNKEEIELSKTFAPLANFDFGTKLGSLDGSSVESRTLGDVDDTYRPGTKYYLNHIYMLALNPKPESQPTDEQEDDLVGVNKIIHYDKAHSSMNYHKLSNGSYKLYYQLGKGAKQEDPDCSLSGSVFLSPTGRSDDAVEFKLSVFLLSDLQNSKDQRIKLNKFAYGKGIKNLRGTTLRYTSYNPEDVSAIALGATAPDGNEEGLKGQYVSLPSVEGYDFLNNDRPKNPVPLVGECQDRFFSGSEFLIAADTEQIYLLQVIPSENLLGGYLQVRTYPTPKGQANPEMLALNRLTTVVNASFMITNKYGKTARYFVEDNPTQSIANFKKQHKIDLSTMSCPYATLDGMNTHYYINEYEKDDKSAIEGRLVLWAKGHEVTGVDGQKYDKQPRLSNNIFFASHSDDNVSVKGFGIEGRSYTVAFQGVQSDTKNAQITFYVTVDGVNVKLVAFLPEAGITFDKNVANNLIVYIPEDKFAKFINKHKDDTKAATRASNEYHELVLPAGSVVVR